MQSKLITAEPLIVNGEHHSWENKKYNTTYYVFELQFENGIKGNANSKTREGSYKLGEEYTFEVQEKGKFKNIKGLKLANSDYNKGYNKKSSFDPKSMTTTIAIKCAIDYMDNHENASKITEAKTVKDIALYFYNEVLKDKPKDKIQDIQSSLKRATSIRNMKLHNNTKEDIIRLAREFYTIQQELKKL